MINDLKQNYSTDNIDTMGKRFIDILQAGIDGLLPIYCFILSICTLSLISTQVLPPLNTMFQTD